MARVEMPTHVPLVSADEATFVAEHERSPLAPVRKRLAVSVGVFVFAAAVAAVVVLASSASGSAPAMRRLAATSTELDNLSVDMLGTSDGISVADDSSATTVEDLFSLFVQKYNRTYDAEEYAKRLKIFTANVNFIVITNGKAGTVPFKLDINELADLTAAEVSAKYLGVPADSGTGTLSDEPLFVESDTPAECVPISGRSRGELNGTNTEIGFTTENSTIPLPTGPVAALDWRNIMPPAENQGGCASCWSFAASAAIEAQYAIKTGKTIVLSKQQLVDCSKGSFACSGGWPQKAFESVKGWGGQALQSAYPYAGRNGACRTVAAAEGTGIKSYKQIGPNDEDAMLKALADGPMTVLLHATSDWQFYKKGVFDGSCGTKLDHAVLLVGYGVDSATGYKYWIVRNSWGAKWGEGGYIRMRRYGGKTQGKCGVAISVYQPSL